MLYFPTFSLLVTIQHPRNPRISSKPVSVEEPYELCLP